MTADLQTQKAQVLGVKGMVKRYPHSVVDGVSFHIEAGETLVPQDLANYPDLAAAKRRPGCGPSRCLRR